MTIHLVIALSEICLADMAAIDWLIYPKSLFINTIPASIHTRRHLNEFGNSRRQSAKGPVIKASLCEEAGGAHAESSCGAAIPGTVCLLKLAQNTELNYHHRQVALLLLLLLRARQARAKTKEVG